MIKMEEKNIKKTSKNININDDDDNFSFKIKL